MSGTKAVIYCKGIPGKTAKAQEHALRRLCEQRGWVVRQVFADPPGRPPRLASGTGRLALIDALLGRRSKVGAVCVWRLGMLGNCIDDLLWLLEEAHIKRGIQIVAQDDGVDTTVDGAATKVIAALVRIGRTGN